jgi:hypothetical protein
VVGFALDRNLATEYLLLAGPQFVAIEGLLGQAQDLWCFGLGAADQQ